MNHGRHAHQNRRFCLEALSSPNFPPHCEKRPCTFIFVFDKKLLNLIHSPPSPLSGEERLARAKTDQMTSETDEKLRSFAHLPLGGPVFPVCQKR